MKIQVTQEDIDKGLRRRIDFCPVALAIRRQSEAKVVHVGGNSIMIDKREYYMPILVQKFITQFDLYSIGLPFQFETYQV